MEPINFFKIAGPEGFNPEPLREEFLRNDFSPSNLIRVVPQIGTFTLQDKSLVGEGPYLITIKTPEEETYELDQPTLALSLFTSLVAL